MTAANGKDNRSHTADSRNPDWDKYVPEGHGRTDEQIRADVHEALRSYGKELGTVGISVGDGIVTLTGQVASANDQQSLTELIRNVPSVRDVQNRVQVKSS